MAQPQYFLRGLGSEAQKYLFPIVEELIVGSVEGASLPHPSISPYHCIFRVQQGILSVSDVGSMQGTFVLGERLGVKKVFLLADGDEIKIGDLLFKVEQVLTPQEKEPPGDLQNLQEALPPLPMTQEEVVVPEDIAPEKQPLPQSEKMPPLAQEHLEEKNAPAPPLEKENLPQSGPLPPQEFEDAQEITADFSSEEIAEESAETMPGELPHFEHIEEIIYDEELDEKKGRRKRKKKGRKTADALIRFFGLTADLALVFFLMGQVGTIPQLEQGLKKLQEYLLQGVNYGLGFFDLSFPQDYQVYLSFFIFFIFYQFVGNLFFGLGPGQFLVGMRSEGSFLWKRLGGTIRSFLAFFTTPTLLTDLPAISSKRTLKEVLSGTRLLNGHFFWRLVGVLILLPLLWILSLASPLLLEKKRQVSFKNTNMQNISKIPVEKQILAKSNLFAFSGHHQKNLEDDYYFLPSFWDKVEGKKRKKLAALSFFDAKEQRIVDVVAMNALFSWERFLQAVKQETPFFAKSFANLNRSLQKEEVASYSFTKELRNLIERAFALRLHLSKKSFRIEGLEDYFFESGPFIKGYIDFRESLLDFIEKTVTPTKLECLEIGKSFYLLAYGKKEVLVLPLAAGKHKIMLLKSTAIRENIKKYLALIFLNLKSSIQEEDEKVIEKKIKEKTLFPLPTLYPEEQYDVWQQLDFFLNPFLSQDQKRGLQDALLGDFKEMIIKHWGNKSAEFDRFMKRQFTNYQNLLTSQKGEEWQGFTSRLAKIYQAFQARDALFFGIKQ